MKTNAKTRAVLGLVLMTALLLSAGCVGDTPEDSLGPGDPVVLAQPDLSTPESAVRSYLDWVSLSYRLANSAVPTATMTPYEGVRVDAYIELNRQQNRGIDQRLTSFEVKEVRLAESTATLSAEEEWEYRYFSLDSLLWSSEPLEASYDTTYTVVRQQDGRWLVDSVEADPRAAVE